MSAAPVSIRRVLTLTILMARLRIRNLNHLEEEHYLTKGLESLPFDPVSSKPSNKCEGCLCRPAVQLTLPLLRELLLM